MLRVLKSKQIEEVHPTQKEGLLSMEVNPPEMFQT